MTEGVDLREFVAGFIAESDELVAAANAALLRASSNSLASVSSQKSASADCAIEYSDRVKRSTNCVACAVPMRG